MGAAVLPPQVVHVVGADEGQIQVARHRQEAGVHHPLLVDALVLHLEEEVAGAQDVPVGGGRVAGALRLLGAEARRHLPLQATAEADEPLRVPGQQVLVDPGLVVEPLGVPGRDELDEVVVAGEVLGQEHEVVVGLAGGAALVAAAAGGDVHLAAEDRLDAALPRLVVEHDAGEHVAVLGDGEGRRAGLRSAWSSSSPMRQAPSSSEYSVCRCRWTNSVMGCRLIRVVRYAAGRRSDATRSRRSGGHSHSIVDGGLLLTS